MPQPPFKLAKPGDIPGGYWAALTHRRASPELQKKVFSDVHMLSHLVGAANRADIRRLVAMEQDNADLHVRLDRQQVRAQELLAERDQALARVAQQNAPVSDGTEYQHAPSGETGAREQALQARIAAQEDLVAVQTARRERAEQESAFAAVEMGRLRGRHGLPQTRLTR